MFQILAFFICSEFFSSYFLDLNTYGRVEHNTFFQIMHLPCKKDKWVRSKL
jgi:hypothetical protein